MKLVKCDKIKGHFYDSEKYVSCPYCGGEERKPEKSIPVMSKEEFEQKLAGKMPIVDEETVMLDQIDLGDNDVTADLSDYTTEELLPESSETPKNEKSPQCELVFENGERYTLKAGHNSVGNVGCDINITGDNGVFADIVCGSDGIEITPLQGGRIYLNGYFLMTTCRVSSEDRLSIGGKFCSFTDSGII